MLKLLQQLKGTHPVPEWSYDMNLDAKERLVSPFLLNTSHCRVAI